MRLAPPIADALQRGATIVAATARAARALRLAYAGSQRSAGCLIWAAPPILDWPSWLRDLFREHAFADPDAPVLLSTLQEQTVWTRVQRGDAALVLSPEAMAALAMDAWSLLSAFQAHSARRYPWEQTDAESFRRWAAEFERECARNAWLSAGDLESFLASRLSAPRNRLALPGEILLVGFDRLTPAQRGFLSALQERGVSIRESVPDPHESERRWISTTGQQDEIAACAAWARELLLRQPGTRIGVIVPSLADLRNPIERAFRRILMPQTEDVRRPSPAMPFEFSLGQPLADVPAIRAALLLLRWIAAPLREEEISWLLLSGFLSGCAANGDALARHDLSLRTGNLLVPERSLAAYRATLAAVPELRRLSEDLSELLQTAEANRLLDSERQPSAWCELVLLLLERAGWPGERSADTVQFQALQRWQRLFDDLALLDFDGSRTTYSSFLDAAERHARETIFSPESHDAPIQIMGPFESSGQQFDALWFMGTDDASWPQRGRLHPLLPHSVQRQFALPHATPDDDSKLAHAVTSRLLASAGAIVFSFPLRDKEAELRPSPLIAGLFPANTQPQPAAPSSTDSPAVSTPSLETISDHSGVLPWPAAQTAGGADVLKKQSACPFQAFATRRLAAEPLEDSEWGLSPADKGKLLHEVLQSFFNPEAPEPILTRDDLAAIIASGRLSFVLDLHIDAALRPWLTPGSPDPWRDAYLAAEKRRLQIRLAEWLEREAMREPFTVEAREERLPDVHIGDLRLNLRADRIDLLPDGSRFILDYKTGQISPSAWNGERPEEPQLPLYAVYGNVENLSGILFAQIRAGETRFAGLVRDAETQLCSGACSKKDFVTEPWSGSMRDDWARVLRDLAAQFLAGEAAVDPRDPKDCTYCPLPALCRKAEWNRVASETNGDDAADA